MTTFTTLTLNRRTPKPPAIGRAGLISILVSFLHSGSCMPIEIDIAHVARLARLALDEQELDGYRSQLGVILEHAARVQDLDTAGLEPTAHPLNLASRFRPDIVEPSLDRQEVLEQAPEVKDGYFVVPPALDAS